MSNATDMPTPVTRGELRAELKSLATKKELKSLATKKELQEAVKELATKKELQEAVKELATKKELQEAVKELATKKELEMWGGALREFIIAGEQRMAKQLASQAKAHHEMLMQGLSALEDKYGDLPGRVKRIEATLYPDEQY